MLDFDLSHPFYHDPFETSMYNWKNRQSLISAIQTAKGGHSINFTESIVYVFGIGILCFYKMSSNNIFKAIASIRIPPKMPAFF